MWWLLRLTCLSVREIQYSVLTCTLPAGGCTWQLGGGAHALPAPPGYAYMPAALLNVRVFIFVLFSTFDSSFIWLFFVCHMENYDAVDMIVVHLF